MAGESSGEHNVLVEKRESEYFFWKNEGKHCRAGVGNLRLAGQYLLAPGTTSEPPPLVNLMFVNCNHVTCMLKINISIPFLLHYEK